jgi:hypothetical protein
MRITRRQAIALLATAAPALRSAYALENQTTLTPGPFTGTPTSLQSYRFPAWFNDAKFGIWAHWGPQSSVEYGDWYARNMYIQGSGQYNYHVETYGHPSRFGYKDLIPQFNAAHWDPDHLIDRSHPIPRHQQPAESRKDHRRNATRPRSEPEIQPGPHRPQRNPSNQPPTHRGHRHHPQTHHRLVSCL